MTDTVQNTAHTIDEALERFTLIAGQGDGETSACVMTTGASATVLRRLPQRFWSKTDQQDDGCMLWTGTKESGGYGRFWLVDRFVLAHRMAYELAVGPIPKGLQLDHLCRVRHCVNPAHLELVTGRVNTLRGETLPAANVLKTHCPRLHPYDETNTYITPTGRRDCRTCRAEAGLRYRARRSGR